MSRTQRNLSAIDLLRFACALLVLAFHYGTVFASGKSPHLRALGAMPALPHAWLRYSWFGWVGVELFFVISGCVIAGSAEGASASDFLRRRALRLFPAAWLCATLGLVMLAVAGLPLLPLLGDWARSITVPVTGPWIDPSYWTLGVEWVFYLLVTALLGRGGGGRLEPLAWGLTLWSLGFWIALALGLLPATLHVQRLPELLLLTHGSFFALGIFARAYLARGLTVARASGVVLALGAALTEVTAHAAGEATHYGMIAAMDVPALVFAAGLLPIFAAHRFQPLCARLPRGLAATLGLATYPLYLIHQDVGGVLLVWLTRAGVPPVVAIATVAAAVIAFAIAVSLWIEPPLRRALAARLGGTAAPVQPAPWPRAR